MSNIATGRAAIQSASNHAAINKTLKNEATDAYSQIFLANARMAIMKSQSFLNFLSLK